MIVAGEASGDLYGALLAGCIKRRLGGIRVIGVGGERMKAAGVELISGISSGFGLAEVISSLAEIRQTFSRAVEALRRERPSVVVLIDYPDFNLRLAEKVRASGLKILYYVSPQVWAWRRKRIGKIAKLVDRMAVVLPFEEELYKKTGLECEFVGHPARDEIEAVKERKVSKSDLGFFEGRPLLSLLPGSRPNELKRLLPIISEVIPKFKKEFPEFQFCVPLSPNTKIEDYVPLVLELKREGAAVSMGNSVEALSVSDYAVVASGTASLQAVLLGVPTVVIYKLSALTYWLGRHIVKVKHISLVNILAGREVVRELLQSDAEPRVIIEELGKLINNRDYKESMIREFGRVSDMFRGKRASERVAEIVSQMRGF